MLYKRICCLLAFAVFIAGFSACGQNELGTKKADEYGRKIVTFTCANLTVTDEDILNAAIVKFEEENPEATVKINDLSKLGYDTDKYINTVNTELMAGKGPDIIPLSYLPAIKYFKKSIFANLGSMIENDKSFQEDKLFTNVIEACKYHGNLYTMPIKFSFAGVFASKEIMDEEGIKIVDKTWTTGEFIDIAKKVTKDLDRNGTMDRYALPQLPMDIVTKLFINTGYFIDYENEKASFDSPKFVELLELLKTISDKKLTHKKIKIGENISYKNSKDIVFSGNIFGGYRSILGLKYSLGGGERVIYKLPSFGESEGYSFDSDMMLTIINTSENKDLAWKFLKVMLSEDVQCKFSFATNPTGFPINKKALDIMKQDVLIEDWKINGDTAGWISIEVTEDDIKFVENYIAQINRIQFSDARVDNIVVDEIGALFSNTFSFNKKDAEDIAKSIQRKVRLYLDE